MRTAFILMLFLVCGAARAQWSTEDKVLTAGYFGLLAADYAQTRWSIEHPVYQESNPILGKRPSAKSVNRYFLAATALSGVALEFAPIKYRTTVLYVGVSFEGLVVARNARIGVRMKL